MCEQLLRVPRPLFRFKDSLRSILTFWNVLIKIRFRSIYRNGSANQHVKDPTHSSGSNSVSDWILAEFWSHCQDETTSNESLCAKTVCLVWWCTKENTFPSIVVSMDRKAFWENMKDILLFTVKDVVWSMRLTNANWVRNVFPFLLSGKPRGESSKEKKERK